MKATLELISIKKVKRGNLEVEQHQCTSQRPKTIKRQNPQLKFTSEGRKEKGIILFFFYQEKGNLLIKHTDYNQKTNRANTAHKHTENN